MPEGVFGLALDRGTAGWTYEFLAGELPQGIGDLGAPSFAHRSHRTYLELPPPRCRRASTFDLEEACRGERRSTPLIERRKDEQDDDRMDRRGRRCMRGVTLILGLKAPRHVQEWRNEVLITGAPQQVRVSEYAADGR